jgi:hypothetical protein
MFEASGYSAKVEAEPAWRDPDRLVDVSVEAERTNVPLPWARKKLLIPAKP